jgi:acetyl esterase/lipase
VSHASAISLASSKQKLDDEVAEQEEAQESKCNSSAARIASTSATFFIWFILPVLRLLLNVCWNWYHPIWMSAARGAIMQDGHTCLSGVCIERGLRYGEHCDETFDIIRPLERKSAIPIVYVHGGAFVAVNSELLLHQGTPIARAGHQIFSLNYPLAPEARFPEAVIAIIRALAHLKEAHGIQSLALFGDSAGGNLVTLVAAILSNRDLLSELQICTEHAIEDLSFPTIDSVVSAYGILDQRSFLGDWSGTIAIGCILRCYENTDCPPAFKNRLALCDLNAYDLKRFPRTFVVAAEQDPLVHSSIAAAAMLRNQRVDVRLEIFPAPHGFLGFPLCWTWGRVQASAVDATAKIICFLQPGVEVPVRWIDCSRPGVVLPRSSAAQVLMAFLETNMWTGLTPTVLVFGLCAAGCCGAHAIHSLLDAFGGQRSSDAAAVALQVANWYQDVFSTRPYSIGAIVTASFVHIVTLFSRQQVGWLGSSWPTRHGSW